MNMKMKSCVSKKKHDWVQSKIDKMWTQKLSKSLFFLMTKSIVNKKIKYIYWLVTLDYIALYFNI